MQTAIEEVSELLGKVCDKAKDPAIEKWVGQVADLCARYMEPCREDLFPGVRLSPNEFGVIQLLYARIGKPVPKWALLENCKFQRGAEDRGDKNVDVYVCRIRKKIVNTAYEIQTVWGTGFRLINKSEQAKAA